MKQVRVLIVHDQYQVVGGAELQNIRIINSLNRDSEFQVASASFDGEERIIKTCKIAGIPLSPRIRFYGLEPSPAEILLRGSRQLMKIKYMVKYVTLFERIVRTAMDHFKPDLVYFDSWRSSHFFHKIYSTSTILYSYFPPLGYSIKYVPTTIISKMYPHNAYMLNRRLSFLYHPLFRLDRNLYININKPTLVYSVSSLVDRLVRIQRKRETRLLFPPIAVSSIIKFKPSTSEKKDIIVTLGRIDPEKNLERSIEVLSRCKIGRLLLMGSLQPGNVGYLRHLQVLAKRLDVSERVSFVLNAPFPRIVEKLHRSKIVLFPQEWGHAPYAAIIEAMAAGCVPLVPRCGAPWEDVTDLGRFGFGYDTVEEAAAIIESIFTDSKIYTHWSSVAKNRSLDFDEKVFMTKLKSHIRKLAS